MQCSGRGCGRVKRVENLGSYETRVGLDLCVFFFFLHDAGSNALCSFLRPQNIQAG